MYARLKLMALGVPKMVNRVVWFLVWLFFAFPFAYFMAFVYVTLNAFRGCLPCLKDFIELTNNYVHFTGTASNGVVEGDLLC